MASGGNRFGSGRPVSGVKQILISSNIPTMIIEQLTERLEGGEIDTKDLISLVGFIVPKLKAIEIETPQENKIPTFNFEILTDDEKLQYHRITSKLLEDEL